MLLSKSSAEPEAIQERIRQVTVEMVEIKFGADKKLLEKMRRLQGLLAHKSPQMKTSELIDELCEIALEKLDPIRSGARPKKTFETIYLRKNKNGSLEEVQW